MRCKLAVSVPMHATSGSFAPEFEMTRKTSARRRRQTYDLREQRSGGTHVCCPRPVKWMIKMANDSAGSKMIKDVDV